MSKVSAAIVLGFSLRKIFNGIIPDDKIHIVPNCCDEEFCLSEKELNRKLDGSSDNETLDVLYLSNFIKEKGFFKVLEIAAKFKNRKNLKFHFAGKFFNETNKTEFFDYIKKQSLEGSVTYHGIVSGDEKRNLLKQSNIFILLSSYPNEGQPISILEAMANGQVIITTNHAGIPDIVTFENGHIEDVNNIDIDRVYTYIDKIYTDRSSLSNIAYKNYLLIKGKYTEDIYIDNIDSIFHKLTCDE